MPEKLLPHDLDAEEAAIGSLLIDGPAILKIADLLKAADFYNERSRLIFDACLALQRRNEAINQITIAQDLARQEKLETCGGTAYLSHLISICPTPLDIEHYAQIVYRLSMMRRLINAAQQIEGIGYEANPDVDESLNRAEDALYELRHGQSSRGFTHIRQLLGDYLATEAPGAEAEAGTIERVISGFTVLDENMFGGFQRGDFIVIAGRPSMGKTSLALNIARNAAVGQNACVAMFSLEMSRESLVQRLLASEAMVNLGRIRYLHQGAESTKGLDEEKRIMDATGILSEAPIYIDDSPQLRVVDMRSKVRRLHYERGVNIIIIDHLGLMQSDTRIDNRVQEISYITRSLKALAREIQVPVIAVSQLSRASEKRDVHKPQLSDLRDSGSIEQDADMVIFIYRDEYYYRTEEEWRQVFPDKEYPAGIANIMVAKHRNGPTGDVQLRFIHNLTKFENLPVSTETEPSLI